MYFVGSAAEPGRYVIVTVIVHVVSQRRGGCRDADQAAGKARFLVAEHGRQRWVFPVDEVLGVHRLSLQNRTALPATLRRSSSRLSRHVYDWNGLHVCHLDADRLFAAMQKGLQ